MLGLIVLSIEVCKLILRPSTKLIVEMGERAIWRDRYLFAALLLWYEKFESIAVNKNLNRICITQLRAPIIGRDTGILLLF